MSLQSVLALGSCIGVLSVPIISDLKGRKVAILLCLGTMLGGNLGIFVGILKSYYLLIGLGMLFSAFGAFASAAVSYSINADFYSDDLRQKAVIYYCAAW